MDKNKVISMTLGSERGDYNLYEKTIENLKSIEEGLEIAKKEFLPSTIVYIEFFEHYEIFENGTTFKSEQIVIKRFYFGRIVSIEEIKERAKENFYYKEVVEELESLCKAQAVERLTYGYNQPSYYNLDDTVVLLNENWEQTYPVE